MAFLAPLALLLGLLAVPIIVLYMLRLRRREVRVSSTLLWQTLMRDRAANAPWQKLRRNLLLFLQLAILAALVLALARPYLPTPSAVTGNVVVLLDGSASMQAADGSPTRFDNARDEAARLVNGLGGDARMTLILAGRTPRVLAAATADKAELRRALDTAVADSAPADWSAAFALASGAVQGFEDARVVLISDGGLPDDLPPLPVALVYLPVGSSGENLALTALATRDAELGPQLFASVANTGSREQSAILSIDVDEVLFDSQRLTIPAGESRSVTWDLAPDTAVIAATLSGQSDDALPVDDRAWTVPAGDVQTEALLVTEGNLFLEQLFRVLPGITAVTAPPDSDLITEPFDLVVFDGVALPDELPAGDMLIVNPQPGANGGLLGVTGTFSDTVAVRLADSPLLTFVDWRTVSIREAQAVDAPWADVLVAAEGGPLVLAGERDGQRIAVLTFDLRQSDLPLQIAFPILMANIMGWLSPGRVFDAPEGLQPGQAVTIASDTGGLTPTAVSVVKPDGSSWRAAVGESVPVFTETDAPGLYMVFLETGGEARPAGSFAVNLFSPLESAIGPRDTVQIGLSETPQSTEEAIGQRELWPWLAVIALVILVAEWWIYFRGIRRPKINLS